MSDSFTLSGANPITVHLRRSPRAKRLSLRVSRLDGKVTLTLPLRFPRHEALAFVQEKEDWVARHLAQQKPQSIAQLGAVIPVEGSHQIITPAPVRSVQRHEGRLLVPDRDPDRTPNRVASYLKLLARDRLVEASDQYAGQIGRAYSKFTLRDTRSRWGSCSSQGGLMYSWRLIMAPPEVLNYVAAHEVAHLVEMNHSPAFWAIVDRLYPGYPAQKAWLRCHGSDLHRWQFG